MDLKFRNLIKFVANSGVAEFGMDDVKITIRREGSATDYVCTTITCSQSTFTKECLFKMLRQLQLL
jgi:hypothetical protein